MRRPRRANTRRGGRRRYPLPPRAKKRPWVNGMYAGALLVLLVLVLLFIRYWSKSAADVYLQATGSEAESHERIPPPSTEIERAIGDAHQTVRQTVDDAQRVALHAIVDSSTSDEP